MTQSIPSNRSKFEEIFNSKHMWALDKNEFEIKDELRIVLEEKSKDKQSIYYIIYRKLKSL